MSFSAELKMEILENRQMRARCKKAFAYGLLLFSKGFSRDLFLAATENPGILKLYISTVKDILGRAPEIISGEKLQNGKTVYTALITREEDRLEILSYFPHDEHVNMDIIGEQGQISAFLSGAYLACGNISAPQKSYHIEFAIKNKALCGDLKEILDACHPGAKITRRRGGFGVYYKEYTQIEDLLTRIGAPKSSLKIIEIEMLKHVRNNANRATNCETANIDKMVDAARSRITDINFVLREAGGEALTEDLKAIASLQLKNPDLSLKELGALLTPPLSRSGAYHRLERISKIAAELRGRRE